MKDDHIRLADEMAERMRRDLEVLTPEEMGYDGVTAEELIESERAAWLDEFARDEEKASRK